jgi:hypothetical protein
MHKRWWFFSLIAVTVVLAGLAIAAFRIARHFDPLVRQLTEQYLQQRFDADVKIGRLKASLPLGSPLKVLLARGMGAIVHVSGGDIKLWLKGHPELPPVLQISRCEFEFELSTLWNGPVDVLFVKAEGFALNIPPKDARARFPGRACAGFMDAGLGVRIRQLVADNSILTILPKDPKKDPMVFELIRLRLFGGGAGAPMYYQATLNNDTPPGIIVSHGTFGPWAAAEPSATPLHGEYTFERADLAVFRGIEGTLSSKGRFSGILDCIVVDGTTDTPDFSLTRGNPIPLKTSFHAVVDGTNGDTLLDPVEAQLAASVLECRGGVVRNKGDSGKTLALDVNLKRGKIDDLLRLAVKGDRPLVRGDMKLRMKLELPPGRGDISDRLRLQGAFAVKGARFTSATVQEKIDTLSRRGQGRPNDVAIGEVPSDLEGSFFMHLGWIDFSRLCFTVPGSQVELAGRYTFDDEQLDFHGKLRLQARVSQTMSGWKRWLLKPLDPFFAKDGAGTVLSIAVEGPRSNPRFGRDHSRRGGPGGSPAGPN